MSSEVSESLRRRVADRAWHVCEYCSVHEDDVYHGCEVTLFRSIKHGGVTGEENLAFACFHCNRHKGSDLGSMRVEPIRGPDRHRQNPAGYLESHGKRTDDSSRS